MKPKSIRGVRRFRRLGCETLEPRCMLSGVTPVDDFHRLAPQGGLGFAREDVAGTIAGTGDQADFQFFAEAGETVSAIVSTPDAAAVLTVSLVGAGSSATAAGPGQSAVLAPIEVTAAGTVTLRVTAAAAASFSVDIYRNLALEAQVGDSGLGNPVDISGSQVAINSDRYEVLGSAARIPPVNTVFEEDFDGGSSTFTFDNAYGSGSGLWHTTTGRSADGLPSHSPTQSIYFGQGEVAPAPTLNWQAQLDTTNNNTWESSVNDASNTRWTFSSASAPQNTPPGDVNDVTQWYHFAPGATMDSIEDSQGISATTQDVTWELVFRASDFTGTHVLFETGGNVNGTAFVLLDNTLEFRVQQANNWMQRVVKSYTFDASADVNQFHHLVAVVHPDATEGQNSVRMFVDGVEVGAVAHTPYLLADWADTDDSGLGTANGLFPASDATPTPTVFDGDIAMLRYYNNRLLTGGEAVANFQDLVSAAAYRVGNYDIGQAVAGEAQSPAITLPATGTLTLSLNTLIQVEDAVDPFEAVRVVVVDTATQAETVLFNRFDGTIPTDSLGQWVSLEADLTPFAGDTVQLLLQFDTGDELGNGYEGWYVDDVRITQTLAPPANDVDLYTLPLAAGVGQTIDIALAGRDGVDFSGQTLQLLGTDGSTVLATASASPLGTAATNYDLALLGFSVPAAGVYTLRLTSTVEGQYAIAVADSLALESEPNDLRTQTLRTLNDVHGGVGYLTSGASQTYASRSSFNSANPGLPVETFEAGLVDALDIATFFGPLDATSDNTVFQSGDIVDGLSVNAQDTNASTPSEGDLALMGGDFLDLGTPGSQVVGANEFVDHTVLTFSGSVFAVGFDVFDLAGGTVTISVFDASSNLLLSTPVTAATTGTFFGLTSNVAIHHVRLDSASGEFVDNVAFGAAGTVPQPDGDWYRLANLQAGQSIVVSTDTLLDNAASSPLNSLDPELLIVNASGVTVITNQNSAPDGKNAVASFLVSTAGDYFVRVGPQSGAGEYLVTVAGINHAPVLDNSGALAFGSIDEDDASNTGTLVATLLVSAGGDRILDFDLDAVEGIAVVGADTAHGAWQYKIGAGGAWTALGTPSTAAARLLASDSATWIRFVPAADWNGTMSAGITFRAWDRSSGTAGAAANTTTNGGGTPFSLATETASLTVAPVNDPPAGTDAATTMVEEGSYTFVAADFGFTDPVDTPPSLLLSVQITTLPGLGSLTLDNQALSEGQSVLKADIDLGKLKYAPPLNGSGDNYTSLTFQVQDDGGTAAGGVDLDSSPNLFTFDVTGTNDPPVIGGLSDSPDPSDQAGNVTLTATGVGDPIDPTGSVVSVAFYRESNGTPGLQIATDTLLGSDNNGTDGWSISSSNSALAEGLYDYYAVATDNDGASSNVASTTNTVEITFNIDADGNGNADALTDGILILRYLFDPEGAWNFNDALGSGATRITRPAIKSFLDLGSTTGLDVDGNGSADALTDGILLLRYLFDPAGAWNFNDALGSGATRTTRPALKAFMDTYNPAVAPAGLDLLTAALEAEPTASAETDFFGPGEPTAGDATPSAPVNVTEAAVQTTPAPVMDVDTAPIESAGVEAESPSPVGWTAAARGARDRQVVAAALADESEPPAEPIAPTAQDAVLRVWTPSYVDALVASQPVDPNAAARDRLFGDSTEDDPDSDLLQRHAVWPKLPRYV